MTRIFRLRQAAGATDGELPTVDRVGCTGRGICAQILPGTIELDEWGYPIVGTQVPTQRALRQAILLCPEMALKATRPGSRETLIEREGPIDHERREEE